MPTLPTLALFMGAALALNLTPGPDMLYVVARSAGEGRRAGLASALGIGAGTLVHIALVAGGLAGVLAAVPLAFAAVKYAGAAYLVYLGVRALLADGGASGPVAVPPAPLAAIFRQGVVTNVLNPKVALFFLALLPQFVDPRRGPVWAQVVLLGMLFNGSGTLVNCAVAVFASRMGAAARARFGGSGAFTRLTGVVFIALGLRLAFAGRR